MRPVLGVTIAVLCASPQLSEAKTGLGGRVRAICFGDVIEQYGGFNNYVVIKTDPAITATLVPSRGDFLGSYKDAMRNMRMYMPRSYSLLTADYDLIFTSDADRAVFRTDWIQWLTDSVTEGGLGLGWLGSIQGTSSYQSWEGTTLAGIAPVGPSSEPNQNIGGRFRIEIQDLEEPLMTALPWEDSPPLANLNTQVPNVGATVWAITDHPSGYPLMTYWRVGRGAVLCFASGFPDGVRLWVRDWPFFVQAMIYIAYRLVDKDVPQDALLFKQLFSEFQEYAERNSLVVSVLQFVEKFGGNVDGLYRSLNQVAESKSAADSAYLEGEYDRSLEMMTKIRADQVTISKEAMAAKDGALLWIYVTEWSALMATLLLSGSLVWALMIRRSLYREVGTSRLAR